MCVGGCVCTFEKGVTLNLELSQGGKSGEGYNG